LFTIFGDITILGEITGKTTTNCFFLMYVFWMYVLI
jgi:hypothetical protein